MRNFQSSFAFISSLILKVLIFLWSMVFLSLVINVFSSIVSLFLPKDWVTFLQKPIQWAFDNPIILALILIILLLLTWIFYLLSHPTINVSNSPSQSATNQVEIIIPNQSIYQKIASAPSEEYSDQPTTNKELKRRYLLRMIRETEFLGVQGIPAGLIAQSVPLDQVFIPLQFHPNRLRVDYPLSDEEIESYQRAQQKGMYSEQLERILFEAEKNWFYTQTSEKIGITNLWNRLTDQEPAAVIQGYPGMGKSTLMARLTLHMARAGLSQNDLMMPDLLKPALIPILISLGKYARECENLSNLSLIDYLQYVIEQLHIANLDDFILSCLKEGRCLIMLDGLDEVSDADMRKQIQKEINVFILEQREGAGNRFLITSRVAGYDQSAFPNFLHYLIADLTIEQIENFLPRWCHANVLRSRGLKSVNQKEQEEVIAAEAAQMARELGEAIMKHSGVRRLAENPLLLTLLAVMQQNSIQLPQRRVELYNVVTRTLLENRNLVRGLPWIPEAQAISRLGPIAYEMQKNKNSFALGSEVRKTLRQIISQEGGTSEQIDQEVETFLGRLRERGGIFVLRTGDYFGFFHRTFQEYFAARYIITQLESNFDTWIVNLIEMAKQSDGIWREPFLLTVAYLSNENKTTAQLIIQRLLDETVISDPKFYFGHLRLCAECVIEAKPLTIEASIQKQISEAILQTEKRGVEEDDTSLYDNNIAVDIISDWLLTLPSETYRPAILIVLSEAINNMSDPMLQQTTLNLLVMVFQKSNAYPMIVYDTLIPPLLSLAGLPVIGKYQPSLLSERPNPRVATLAFATLSYMGRQGPNGLLLTVVRQHFKDYPNHLRLLVGCSLESKALLIPILMPLNTDNYRQYKYFVSQWLSLCNKKDDISDRDREICLNVYQSLLDCAEEASYPIANHVLALLQMIAEHPDGYWKDVWQNYLSMLMASGEYVNYISSSLLWAEIFPQREATKKLTSLILSHYFDNDSGSLHLCAQYFISLVSDYVIDMFDHPVEEAEHVYQILKHRDSFSLEFLGYQRSLLPLRAFQELQELDKIRNTLYIEKMPSDKVLSDLLYLSKFQVHNLGKYLLNFELSEIIINNLHNMNSKNYLELLTICLGRMIQIQDTDEISSIIEEEVKQIAQTVITIILDLNESKLAYMKSSINYKARQIIAHLPARSAKEVEFILQLAKNEDLKYECAEALERSKVQTPAVTKFLAELKPQREPLDENEDIEEQEEEK